MIWMLYKSKREELHEHNTYVHFVNGQNITVKFINEWNVQHTPFPINNNLYLNRQYRKCKIQGVHKRTKSKGLLHG